MTFGIADASFARLFLNMRRLFSSDQGKKLTILYAVEVEWAGGGREVAAESSSNGDVATAVGQLAVFTADSCCTGALPCAAVTLSRTYRHGCSKRPLRQRTGLSCVTYICVTYRFWDSCYLMSHIFIENIMFTWFG